MSIIPAFVNAIFSLNKKGEYLLYEGPIEGGRTRVTIITKISQNIRYYKVHQIIALEGQMAIKQDFEISQEMAYRLIEKDLVEKISNTGEENVEQQSIPVVITGQSTTHNPGSTKTFNTTQSSLPSTNNSTNSYKSVVSSQSRKFEEGYSAREANIPDYNDRSFQELDLASGGGSFTDFSGTSEIKIANISSFKSGSNSSRDRDQTSRGYTQFEDLLNSDY